jgi:hypothetical protein
VSAAHSAVPHLVSRCDRQAILVSDAPAAADQYHEGVCLKEIEAAGQRPASPFPRAQKAGCPFHWATTESARQLRCDAASSVFQGCQRVLSNPQVRGWSTAACGAGRPRRPSCVASALTSQGLRYKPSRRQNATARRALGFENAWQQQDVDGVIASCRRSICLRVILCHIHIRAEVSSCWSSAGGAALAEERPARSWEQVREPILSGRLLGSVAAATT